MLLQDFEARLDRVEEEFSRGNYDYPIDDDLFLAAMADKLARRLCIDPRIVLQDVAFYTQIEKAGDRLPPIAHAARVAQVEEWKEGQRADYFRRMAEREGDTGLEDEGKDG